MGLCCALCSCYPRPLLGHSPYWDRSPNYHGRLFGGGHKVTPAGTVCSATKLAVRAISEVVRQEVKPYNLRTRVISPGAVATELPSHITDEQSAAGIQKFYEGFAIAADSFARAVAFAISQPDDVDVNEILFRPTRQEL